MKRLMLTILLCAVAGLAACSGNRASLASNERAWKSRGTGVLPRTDAEKLAVELMQAGGKPLVRGDLKAYREGEERGHTVVAVEEIPSGPEDSIEKIRYKMLGLQILFESDPQYLTQIDRKREANARTVAYQARGGTLPPVPEIFDDKYFYEPTSDGGCRMEVTEKDLERQPVGSYVINVCE